MIDFIRGERFIEIADFTFAPNNSRTDDYTHLRNTLDLSKVKDGDIIYTHTFYVHDLFELLQGFDKTVRVVTHNCDMNVDFAPPDCVSMWFSQNVNITHPRVQSIPIGLQNKHWNRYGDKDAAILNLKKRDKSLKNLVYMNHNVSTNSSKRQGLYESMGKQWWVTAETRTQNFARINEYYEDVYNHLFMICPEGNGIDTHRIWECLYLNTVPIVLSCVNTEFYRHLPIVMVRSWDIITDRFLEQWAEIFSTDFNEYDMSMIYFEYWKNKILTT